MAYAIAAARMALDHARLVIDDELAPRIGVTTGCGLGGLSYLEQTTLTVLHQKPQAGIPLFHPHHHRQHVRRGSISIHLGAKGPNATLATACAAGAHAVGEAYEAILNGHADAMITGGRGIGHYPRVRRRFQRHEGTVHPQR
jgi:3-oxoacyl-[acyl-carrier-protein] synthase II